MHEASRPAAESRPRAKKMKSRGHPHAGLHFYVWDEDRRTAAAWAEQLADVERSIEVRHDPQPHA
jgi:hypothetical protein